MRTAKRYTNTTFTHRPDHDKGEHRTGRAPAEPLVCRGCGAVFTKRRWVSGSTAKARALGPSARPTLCPACDMKHKHLARGFLTMRGAFFVAHRTEIEALLRAEEARAVEDNPTGRILDWDTSKPDELTVSASTEHLVQRLGSALNKAYSGDVSYDFSHENKLARVTWVRT